MTVLSMADGRWQFQGITAIIEAAATTRYTLENGRVKVISQQTPSARQHMLLMRAPFQ